MNDPHGWKFLAEYLNGRIDELKSDIKADSCEIKEELKHIEERLREQEKFRWVLIGTATLLIGIVELGMKLVRV